MKIKINALVVAALVLCVSGCAQKPVKPDPVEVALSESFGRIATSMETLAKIEAAEHSDDYGAKSYAYDESKVPALWLSNIELVEDYHGDLSQFLEMVSRLSGLDTPRIDTPRTGRPVVIAIAKGKRRVISFIADAGNQAGDSALIIPSFPLNRVIIKYNK